MSSEPVPPGAARVLSFFKAYTGIRRRAFGSEFLEAEYWFILNQMRHYPPGYTVGVKEFSQICNLPEGKMSRRLLRLEQAGWLTLDKLPVISREVPKLRNVSATETLHGLFDDHIAEAMRAQAAAFLDTSGREGVDLAIEDLPRPYPEQLVETFCETWSVYAREWQRLVRDLFVGTTWDNRLESLRLKMLTDEIQWLIVMCQPLYGPDGKLSDAFIDFNGLIAAMNEFVVAPVSKVREDLSEMLDVGAWLQSERNSGARLYRLDGRARQLLAEHLASADEIFLKAARNLPQRSARPVQAARIRLVKDEGAAS